MKLNIAVLSLYNGHVSRGVESFAKYFVKTINEDKSDKAIAVLIQGGQQLEKCSYIKSVNVYASDSTGDTSLAGVILRNLEVMEFYKKAIEFIKDQNIHFDYIFPLNNQLDYVKNLLKLYDIESKIIGVGGGGDSTRLCMFQWFYYYKS
ncbi:MAG: hypothetical protein ACYCSQ_01210 [bacterium]